MIDNTQTPVKIEYIWLDGGSPQKLRSKTKILRVPVGTNIDDIELPEWNYDGSSTNQASTSNSEIIIIPRTKFKDPFEGDILVMCDTYDIDRNPIESNQRCRLEEIVKEKDKHLLLGFEQEYIMIDIKTDAILGWPHLPGAYPEPQGDYYCGAGAKHVRGREIAFKHMEKCLEAGLSITGVNAEVMLGQWEYQIGPVSALNGSDELWMSRYILYRIGEEYGVEMNIEPKPVRSEHWNGSGMHVNFSTDEMRDKENIKSGKSIELIESACRKLEENHEKHIKLYGENNKYRLTGKNETASYKIFTWGYGDRGASIRVPYAVRDKKAGYLEDRRPGANADPYVVVREIINTVL